MWDCGEFGDVSISWSLLMGRDVGGEREELLVGTLYLVSAMYSVYYTLLISKAGRISRTLMLQEQ